MKLGMEITYLLRLNTKELRLVSTALRGGLKEDQLEEAKELQAKIMEAKVSETKALMHEVEKLEQNLQV